MVDLTASVAAGAPAVPLSVSDWVARYNAGERRDQVFFWEHHQEPSAPPTKRCFSQWYPAAMIDGGQTYPTAEHYMMAGKARLFGDLDSERLILCARTPFEAKALGRRVRNFREDLWSARRLAVVIEGNRLKFSQHPALARFLLDTGDRILVEASPDDRIWGIGLAETYPGVADPNRWRGLNLLGFALMMVREELRAGRQARY